MECSHSSNSNTVSSTWIYYQSPLAGTFFVLNVFCLVWSLILVLDILLVDVYVESSANDYRPGATAMYLLWSFGTTVIWCVEVGLKQFAAVYYSKHTMDSKSGDGGGGTGGDHDGITATNGRISTSQQETCLERFFDHWVVRWIEVVLAILFLVDSFRLLHKWRLEDGDLGAELGEAIFTAAIFLFISYESWILYQKRQRLRRGHDADHDLEAGNSSTPPDGGNGTSGTSAGFYSLWDDTNQQRTKKVTTTTSIDDGPCLELPYGISS
jgi:hypothetical protein